MKKLIIMGSIVVGLILLYFGIKFYAQSKAKDAIDDAIESVERFVDVTYSDISVEPITQNFTITDVVVTPKNGRGQEFTVDEINVTEFSRVSEGEIPPSLAIGFKGLTLDKEILGGEFDDLMEGIGNEDEVVKIDLSLDYDYDEDDEELDLNNLAIEMQDLAKMSLSASLSEMPKPSGLKALRYLRGDPILLQDAKIVFDNDTYYQKMISFMAEEENSSEADVEANMRKELERMSKDRFNRFEKEAAKAVLNFMDDPDRLTLEIDPPKPVNIYKIAERYRKSPNYAMDLLGIEIY